jgi:hypothetical protein
MSNLGGYTVKVVMACTDRAVYSMLQPWITESNGKVSKLKSHRAQEGELTSVIIIGSSVRYLDILLP